MRVIASEARPSSRATPGSKSPGGGNPAVPLPPWAMCLGLVRQELNRFWADSEVAGIPLGRGAS